MTEGFESEQLCRVIHQATTEVLASMLGLDMKVGEAYVERAPRGHLDGVVSYISLAGAWAGTGSLFCSSATACRLSTYFVMKDFSTVDDNVLDAIGELTNMIIGGIKNEMEVYLGPVDLSIPTVIHGRNFVARSLGGDGWTVVPFWCGADRLDVKICLTPASEPAHFSQTRFRALMLQ